jgi:hypothetical protein
MRRSPSLRRAITAREMRAWYDALSVGEFMNPLMLEWRAADRFVVAGAFYYMTGDLKMIPCHGLVTDGGTVHPLLQAASGITRWKYGPAFVVHDKSWEMDMTLGESADLLAEAIKTMMVTGRVRENIGDCHTIWQAVKSPIARRWFNRRKNDYQVRHN